MKRILPRFSRCLLIAVLAAALAVPLAPTGTAVGDSSDDPTLTISPSSAVPGQAITVSGSGFTGNAWVSLHLSCAGETVVVAGAGAADRTPFIPVSASGTFAFSTRVPFHDTVTATSGAKTWTARETTTARGARSASSSGFTIQKRSMVLSPSTATPGATVDVFGSGWGVKTRGSVSSRVTITLQDDYGHPILNTASGSFSVSPFGEFIGLITVPSDADVPRLMVIATDNNGPTAEGGADGFSANQTATAALRVSTAEVTITPSTAPTWSVVTISGKGFPARTPLSELNFGGADQLPSPPPETDASGSFAVALTVHSHCPAGALCPAAVVVTVRVDDVVGHASFHLGLPSISLSVATARPGDTITINGSDFSAFANVDTINIGQANQAPWPNPRTDAIGAFSAEVLVPALNPGAYTVTVRTGPAFTATAPIIIGSLMHIDTVPPEVIFRALTSRGLLTLAAAALPGERFDAYVPGLPGDTLTLIPRNGVLVLTLNEEARISVSGQPAVDVAADTPTFFALGSEVSVKVIEHDS